MAWRDQLGTFYVTFKILKTIVSTCLLRLCVYVNLIFICSAGSQPFVLILLQNAYTIVQLSFNYIR